MSSGRGTVFAAPSLAVRIQTSDAALARRLAECFPRLNAVSPQPTPQRHYVLRDRGPSYYPTRWLVSADDDVLPGAPDAAAAVDALLVDLDGTVIARNSDRALVVHAGAVEVGGRVAVLPAASGSGKTTMTAACVAAGAAYVTDEAVVIERGSLRVEPYHRPLCVKPGSRQVLVDLTGLWAPEDPLCTWHVPPAALGKLSAGGEPAAVVLPHYRPAGGVEVESIPRAEAVLALAGQASYLSQQGPEMLEVLAAVVRGSTCVRIRYDDARVAAHAVLELLA